MLQRIRNFSRLCAI